MLRTALQSVAGQTAVAKIDRVIVSENGGDQSSEKLCAEFPQLPITYIFRSPAMSPLEHGKLLYRDHAEGGYTAILHDDDWWAPTHIENALAALESEPDASAYGAGHFVVSGESSMLNCSGNLFPWFGANYPAFAPWWTLSRINVLMAELLGTVSHFSTLVARTAALREAAFVFETGNTFDNDRMLMFALSASGPLLFNPTPQAFVRNHGVQDCVTYDGHAKVKHMCATTRWLVEQSGRSWDAILASFNRRTQLCPGEAKATLNLLAMKEWCLPEMKKHAGQLVAA